MADRYSRMQYEFYRMGRARTNTENETDPNSSVDALVPSDRGEGELVGPIVESSANEDATILTQENRPIIVKFPASSIETSRLHANLGGPTPNISQSKSPKTLTIHTSRPREPPVPIFDNDKDYTNCIWCFQMIDRSVLHIRANGHNEWSNEGRRHYRQDLQPYVCIAASCSKLRPTYSSSREWFNHMVSAHSECWSQNLHNKPLLTCLAGHDNNSASIFSTRDELFNHNILHHNHIEELNIGKGDDGRAEDYAIEGASLASLCPLCFFRVETDLDHEEKPTDDYTSPDEASQGQRKKVKYSKNTTGPEKIVTSWAMGSHIAEHLHYLMVVSLQLMSAMNGELYGKNDTESTLISNSSSNIISGPGKEVREKLEDLSSNSMKSLGWFDLEGEDEILDSPKSESIPERSRSDYTSAHQLSPTPSEYTPGSDLRIPRLSDMKVHSEEPKIEISNHEYYNLLKEFIRKAKSPFNFRKRTLGTMAKRLEAEGREIREELGLSQDDLVGLAAVSLYDIYIMCSDGESMEWGGLFNNLLVTLESIPDWAAKLGQGISLRFINNVHPADGSWDGLRSGIHIRNICRGIRLEGRTPLAEALKVKIFDPIIRKRFSIDSSSGREGEVKPAIVAIITNEPVSPILDISY
ncbi:hypothetical protein EYR41_004296 [Orbilia oligospora]|uniref:C2H2-type domain-containing protein n=1 Tax=Orbilia oligospora TaxID=2813651 RepID=A0A8H2E7K4_ORBOL|nr:hypothetical protein EYR41_004296 [Orbilia oligospora]